MDYEKYIDFEQYNLNDYAQLVTKDEKVQKEISEFFKEYDRETLYRRIILSKTTNKIDEKILKKQRFKVFEIHTTEYYTLLNLDKPKQKIEKTCFVTHYLFKIDNVQTTFIAKFYNYKEFTKKAIKSISTSPDLKYFKIEFDDKDINPIYYKNKAFDFRTQENIY